METPNPSSPENTVRKIGSSIGTVVFLIATLNQLPQALQQLRKVPSLPLGIWVFFLVSVLLFFVYQLGTSFRYAAQLQKRGGLSLFRDNPSHLIARTSEVRILSNLVAEGGRSYLVGEAGIGKTALVVTGVTAELEAQRCLVLYIDCSRPESARQLFDEWSETIRRGLTPEEYAEVLQAVGKTNKTPARLIEQAFELTTQTIVVIVDQLDQYLLKPPKTGAIPAGSLSYAGLYKELEGLCDKDKIALLSVVRSETLDAARLAVADAHPQYELGLIDAISAQDMLADLVPSTGGNVFGIANPERGWRQLNRLLIEDLSEEGRILPLRLKLAFDGLAELPRLTPAAYRWAGELRGLEAAAIRGYCVRTAQVGWLRPSKRRAPSWKVLAKALDLLEVNGKRVSKNVNELAADLDLQSDEIPALGRALGELASINIVHCVPPCGAGDSELCWTLSHDCLIEPVRNSVEDLGTLRIRNSYEKYREDKRFRRLLGPWTVVNLVVTGRARRANLRPMRGYIRRSSLRAVFLVAPALIVAFILLFEASDIFPNSKIRDYLYANGIGIFSRPLSEEEVRRRIQESSVDIVQILQSRISAEGVNKGWIAPLGRFGDQPLRETWIQAQAASALVHAGQVPGANELGDHLLEVLAVSARDLWVGPGKAGSKGLTGWKIDDQGQTTGLPAEPILWEISAIGWSFHTATESRISSLTRRFVADQATFSQFQSQVGLGVTAWNRFPQQTDPNQHSVYTAALAANAMLDMLPSPWLAEGVKFEPKPAIINTCRWLESTYREVPGIPGGWGPFGTPSLKNQAPEGLSYTVFATLLRAERELAGYHMRPDLRSKIPGYLGRLIKPPYPRTGRPSTQAPVKAVADLNDIEFLDYKGKTGKMFGNFRFAWFPWAIQCAEEWLHSKPEPQDISEIAEVKRVRDVLVQGIPAYVDAWKRGVPPDIFASFVGAEMLYSLAYCVSIIDEL